ncbi:hypothetical protein D2E29_08795 [Mycobacteroides abscessus]|uniref:Secreted protein n=11 Tax=Mycobacteroides abscessus TaxID=36809 RepID=B1MDF4_MYCA9|nr:hypothetical protein DDT48_13460 [Mycobacteroides abscessus]EPQ23184.1 hypothetical protein J108_14930 [Mycobacteroides abscessus subsp. bolletii CRM-0020]EPZ21289.1 hypothetical protein M879_07770 [Mycobacteroides abscessus V06705]ORA28115.1 hypothetical protein BST18_12375 [Mycobacteroides abscessus subsp. bolletii]QCO25970.1 hypothetical protein CFE69_08520 [Mycobacteroides abscessus subsp. massiliense]RTZ52322.1 hypothetical protein CJN95_003250 [Mycobacteroides abscessus subsp. abscess
MTKVPTMRAGIPAMTVAATALALSLGLVAPAAAVADVYPPWWVCMANGGEMRAFYQVVSEQDALDRFHDAVARLSQSTGKPAHVDVCQPA